LGDGGKKERTPEPVRASARQRAMAGDASSMSSTLDKLWTERVDYLANLEVPSMLIGYRIVAVQTRIGVDGGCGGRIAHVARECAIASVRTIRSATDSS
jgi:hypothetical protein